MSGKVESTAQKASAGPGSGWRRGALISAATVMGLLLLGEASFRVFPIDRQLDYEFDEDLYWRLKADQSGFLWMGGGGFHSPPIRIDERGFRSNGARAGDGGVDGFRILMLGDSYTFGLGVRDEETFCALVGDRLAAFDVATDNAGAPGYGVFQSARKLKRELANGGSPDLAVLTLPTGDVLRQPFPSEDFARYRESQIRRKRLRSFSRMATFFYRKYVALKQRRSEGVRAVPNERAAGASETFRKLWEEDEQRIREMKASCDAAVVELIVLHWPQPGMEDWNGVVKKGVERLARETGLAGLTELPKSFEGRALGKLIIPGDGHPSALAHRLAAEYLALEIQRRIQVSKPLMNHPKPL